MFYLIELYFHIQYKSGRMRNLILLLFYFLIFAQANVLTSQPPGRPLLIHLLIMLSFMYL